MWTPHPQNSLELAFSFKVLGGQELRYSPLRPEQCHHESRCWDSLDPTAIVLHRRPQVIEVAMSALTNLLFFPVCDMWHPVYGGILGEDASCIHPVILYCTTVQYSPGYFIKYPNA
jgi:hypothetical protein